MKESLLLRFRFGMLFLECWKALSYVCYIFQDHKSKYSHYCANISLLVNDFCAKHQCDCVPRCRSTFNLHAFPNVYQQ